MESSAGNPSSPSVDRRSRCRRPPAALAPRGPLSHPSGASGVERSLADAASADSAPPPCVRVGARRSQLWAQRQGQGPETDRSDRIDDVGPIGTRCGSRWIAEVGWRADMRMYRTRARTPAPASAAMLAVYFVADRQRMAAPLTAPRQYLPARLRLHARAEPVVLDPLLPAGISIRRLHLLVVSVRDVVRKKPLRLGGYDHSVKPDSRLPASR